mmetsp:Transcript_12538/g.29379  ORF Transcript_12538/g.29379 Transcript_12538/m.29379 type:complete len:412 (+) Transcript_12538:76-1311(+)|eukprot:CAMPEP_0172394540 /NCGR_PEP_ID=MMETSP1061-20121228/15599_1 /TAXON_ID=37318 /ORGANISM="Pseudo-nitzschia pungens, Strain cf. pungens" /LENGTH=411 /DNA_ID=CAMNT_0013125937 /DNA_START=14 /DNA_END=1249 /DNA_ORIENTATION=-
MGLMQRLKCEKKSDGDDTESTATSTHADIIAKKKGKTTKGKNTCLQLAKGSKKSENDGDLLTGLDDTEFPEEYWEEAVLTKFPSEHRDLLAETLFCHIWKTQGKSVALKLMGDYENENLNQTANNRFRHGCQLWRKDDYEGAGWELERSLMIRDVQQSHQSLVNVRYLKQYKEEGDENKVSEQVSREKEIDEIVQNYANADPATEQTGLDRERSDTFVPVPNGKMFRVNTLSPSPTESSAQLYYALGMVRMSQEDHVDALMEFRRAIQVAALGLGVAHDLTKAATYMIRAALLTMGYKSHEIRKYLVQLKSNIYHEIEADVLYESGNINQALAEYTELNFLHDPDSQVQARIRTKIASIFEERGEHIKAIQVWADLLVLYDDTPSIGLHHPLARKAIARIVEGKRLLHTPY